MNSIDWVSALWRWAHILPAVLVVGGTIFQFRALSPALRSLPDAQRDEVRERVRKRWAMIVHLSILLLLASGIRNYFWVARAQHDGQAIYHALFGIKFLLALGVFFIAEAMVGKSAALAPIRAKQSTFMLLNIVLAVAVILIAGLMNNIPPIPVLSSLP